MGSRRWSPLPYPQPRSMRLFPRPSWWNTWTPPPKMTIFLCGPPTLSLLIRSRPLQPLWVWPLRMQTWGDIMSSEADVEDPLAPPPPSLTLELAITNGPSVEIVTREPDFTLTGSLPGISEEEEEIDDTCVARELLPLAQVFSSVLDEVEPCSREDASPAPVLAADVAVEEAPLEPKTCLGPWAVDDHAAPESAVDLEITRRILPDNLIVYSRRPRRLEDPTTPATVFFEKITKKVDGLVPVPSIPKRRTKTAGLVSLPRRSRRIAKLPPDTDLASAATVCRKLGLADEDGKITEDTLNRYAKFYNHLLGRDHVAALSALFGWDVPEGGQARVAAGSIAVF
ncbi:hypothetical protein PVAP13_2KG225800 [Panicum virgatum]|uniref:Uncharacterized protein n=1 Tax=Panicum virgatum TaxID=38727 RepID=A0A8T0VXH3_PANVG|nr:hypothetical protein PVAP13_2KG225800 [Panicum virgatum]